VGDTVRDVRLGPQRARDRAVRLEAQPFDVARVCPRARHPDAGRLDPALVWLPLVRDQSDVVEPGTVELGKGRLQMRPKRFYRQPCLPVKELAMRVLAVGAHPDDLEILCGGTLARYVQEGHEVVMCHATRGDRGSFIHTSEEIAQIRGEEAARAAEIAGAQYVSLGLHD